MYLHFKTQECEIVNLLDNGELGPQRKLYYRELIARFGHHLALNWNLGEEVGLDYLAMPQLSRGSHCKPTIPIFEMCIVERSITFGAAWRPVNLGSLPAMNPGTHHTL